MLLHSITKPKKITIESLIGASNMKPIDRLNIVQNDLKNRLAYKALEIEKLPYGLGKTNSIKQIGLWYINSFKEILEYDNSKKSPDIYKNVLANILHRHSPTMIKMSKGILEWKKDLEIRYNDTINLLDDEYTKNIIPQIEIALNNFYFDRISIRLIIGQFISLDNDGYNDSYNDIYRGEHMNGHLADHIGIISKKTIPHNILVDAYNDVTYMSNNTYGVTPKLIINDNYVYPSTKNPIIKDSIHFTYVPSHLHHVFVEILKNAVVATINKYSNCDQHCDKHCDQHRDQHCDQSKLPPINVTIMDKDSNTDEFAIKISDYGIGMTNSEMANIWSYFYSTSIKTIFNSDSVQEFDDFDRAAPISGFGYGLPISKLLMHYFDGDISINSIKNKGTDVYLYFKL